MVKLSRIAVAAVLFAGAGLAAAQPPGPGRPGFPGGGEKKDFPKREGAGDRKDGERPPADALERELQMLRDRIAEIEGQLKRSGDRGDRKPDEPRGDARKPDEPRGDRGDRKPEDPKRDGPRGTPFGAIGGGAFPFGPGSRGPNPGGPGFGGPGDNSLDKMSAEQIKQIIGRLQQALEAKTRGDQPKKPEGNRGDQPKKPEGGKGNGPREGKDPGQAEADILKRLSQIQKELEEIRRSLGK